MTLLGIFASIGYTIKKLLIGLCLVTAFELIINLIVWLLYVITVLLIRDNESHKRTISTRATVGAADRKLFKQMGYQLLKECVGNGYYGSVYKAYRLSTDSTGQQRVNAVAIKVIDVRKYHKILMEINEIDYKSLRQVFDKSVDTLDKIRDKRIVKIEKIVKTFSAHSADGQLINKLFVVSPMADINLQEFIEGQEPSGLTEELARQWFTDICQAVRCLHVDHKVSHQNIKPENILLFVRDQTNQKTTYDVKLSDTGIASLFPNSAKVHSQTNPICVLSPPDSSTSVANPMSKDIYSLGLVLVFILKGNLTKLFVDNNPLSVFANFNDKHIEDFKNKPLRELLEAMICSPSDARPTIDEVLQNQWLKN